MIAQDDFQPTFRKHPATVLGGIANLGWTFDDEVDLDYHLRRSALPTPGRVRDLLELTSRLHGTLLDRHRPLWEAHLVEGLNDGRFAVYVKFHHALIDGVSALKLTQRTLSTDPYDTEVRVPWNLPQKRRESAARAVVAAADHHPDGGVGRCAGTVDSVIGSRRAARTTADVAVRRAANHVQCSDRRRPPGGRPVLVAGPRQEHQAGGRGDRQRRGARNVCRRASPLPHRAERAARRATDRDGSGESAQRGRGRQRWQHDRRPAVQPRYEHRRSGQTPGSHQQLDARQQEGVLTAAEECRHWRCRRC